MEKKKRRLKTKDTEEILVKYGKLTRRAKRLKTAESLIEYKEYEQWCLDLFEYLVERRTRKYRNFHNYKDLQQEARIALLAAIRTFKPKKNTPFVWWATQYINTKVGREANRHSAIKIPLKKAAQIKPKRTSILPDVIDYGSNALQELHKKEIIEKVQEAIKLLPADEQKIIRLNGIKLYSISRISNELAIARPECERLLDQAIEKLREHLKNL